MRKQNPLLPLALLALLLIMVIFAVPTKAKSQDERDAADEAVTRAVALGVVEEPEGFEEFRSSDPMSFGEFVEICRQAFGEQATKAISELGEFEPSAPLTYGDAVYLLYRIWASAGGDLSVDIEDALDWAAERDNGASWEKLWHNGQISRADACEFFLEICELS